MFGFWPRSSQRIEISQIRSDDLQACADIHAASFSAAWGDGTLNSMLKTPGMHGLVARSAQGGGNPIRGFVIFRIVAKEAEIMTIAVHPQYRRHAIGKALLDEMTRFCLSERLHEIFLEVDEGNSAAVHLYRQHGFKKVGERKGYYTSASKSDLPAQSQIADDAPHRDALIMRLNLLD